MAVDANGIVQFTTADPIDNLQTTLNSLGSSVSTALTGIKPLLVYKASSAADATTQKDTLATAGVVGTVAKPLIFFRTDNKQWMQWNGSAWSNMAPTKWAGKARVAYTTLIGEQVMTNVLSVSVPAAQPSGRYLVTGTILGYAQGGSSPWMYCTIRAKGVALNAVEDSITMASNTVTTVWSYSQYFDHVTGTDSTVRVDVQVNGGSATWNRVYPGTNLVVAEL